MYRRFMTKIASRIADRHQAKFLVLGDSFSQVSSFSIDPARLIVFVILRLLLKL